ncbi:MAG: dUTP diphosphatase [Ginsengibacter sp.]
MQKLEIRIINHSRNSLPEYATSGSAGLDLKANIEDAIILKPLERRLIPTGIFIELPKGYEAQVRPRSGLAIRHGITCLNSPGTVDSDYRGELKVILINLSDEDFVINNGERIAQVVISRFERVKWIAVAELENSDRGTGGFGHTGT